MNLLTKTGIERGATSETNFSTIKKAGHKSSNAPSKSVKQMIAHLERKIPVLRRAIVIHADIIVMKIPNRTYTPKGRIRIEAANNQIPFTETEHAQATNIDSKAKSHKLPHRRIQRGEPLHLRASGVACQD